MKSFTTLVATVMALLPRVTADPRGLRAWQGKQKQQQQQWQQQREHIAKHEQPVLPPFELDPDHMLRGELSRKLDPPLERIGFDICCEGSDLMDPPRAPVPRGPSDESMAYFSKQPMFQRCPRIAVTHVMPGDEAAHPSITQLLELSEGPWCVVLVATSSDVGINSVFHALQEQHGATRMTFLTLEEQRNMPLKLAAAAKSDLSDHAWRNVGYIYAVAMQPEYIYDFNAADELLEAPPARPETFERRDRPLRRMLNLRGKYAFFDPYYSAFSAPQDMWARGFPFNRAQSRGKPLDPNLSKDQLQEEKKLTSTDFVTEVSPFVKVGIVQSVIQGYPDVDAMYRNLSGVDNLPFEFSDATNEDSEKDEGMAVLDHYIMGPLNAQATLYCREAFWALLLPTTVSGRVADIWRGYVAQSHLWGVGLHVAYHRAWVRGSPRHHHMPTSLLPDFEAEHDLYNHSQGVIRLNRLDHSTDYKLAPSLEKIYESMYSAWFLEEEDIVVMQLWLEGLSAVGYSFPEADNAFVDLVPVPMAPMGTPNSIGTDELCLYVRMFYRRDPEYHDYLVQSLRIFYPTIPPGQLVVVLDDAEMDHAFGARISKEWPYPKIYYHTPPKGIKGHTHQQGAYFNADKWCPDSTYVGMVDSDSVLVTSFTRDAMFDPEGRPYILGQVGNPVGGFWQTMPVTSAAIMGMKSFMRGMSYFPVVMKAEHMKELREFVSKQHGGKDFDWVWENVRGEGALHTDICAYDMMVDYMWRFHPDEYNIRIQRREGRKDPSTPDERKVMAPTFISMIDREEGDKAMTPAATEPLLRFMVHAGYQNGMRHILTREYVLDNSRTFKAIMYRGWCMSGGAVARPDFCAEYRLPDEKGADRLFRDDTFVLWQFEFSNWYWDERCLGVLRSYFTGLWTSLCRDLPKAAIDGGGGAVGPGGYAPEAWVRVGREVMGIPLKDGACG